MSSLNGSEIVTKHEAALAKLTDEQRKQPCYNCPTHHRREQHEFGKGLCTAHSGVFLCDCRRFRGKPKG